MEQAKLVWRAIEADQKADDAVTKAEDANQGSRLTVFQLLEALLMVQQIALPQLKAFLRETGRLQSLEAGLNLSAVPLRTLGFGFGFDH